MPASDTFANFQGGLQTPPDNAFAVTPNNTGELPFVTRALYVGGAGDVAVVLRKDGAPVTFVAVPAGSMLPLRVRQVLVTGTTATALVGIY